MISRTRYLQSTEIRLLQLGDATMRIEDLRIMLLGWALKNVEDHKSPENRSEPDPRLHIQGSPYCCTVRVLPHYRRDQSGPILTVRAAKDLHNGWCFTIDVDAKTAGMAYNLRVKEKGEYPQFEVRQYQTSCGLRSSDFTFKRSVPALLLDVIESRLPDAFREHEDFFFPIGGNLKKPCMSCGESTDWERIVCPECTDQ